MSLLQLHCRPLRLPSRFIFPAIPSFTHITWYLLTVVHYHGMQNILPSLSRKHATATAIYLCYQLLYQHKNSTPLFSSLFLKVRECSHSYSFINLITVVFIMVTYRLPLPLDNTVSKLSYLRCNTLSYLLLSSHLVEMDSVMHKKANFDCNRIDIPKLKTIKLGTIDCICETKPQSKYDKNMFAEASMQMSGI